MFQPEVLKPSPDPFIVKELAKIDPLLRISFGYERYYVKKWAIERKLTAERYQAAYGSLFEAGLDRYVQQPIYDDAQPLFDADGNRAGAAIVGYRKFDLAPEYEWVKFIETPKREFRHPNIGDIIDLKREYAWNRFHSFSRAKIEMQQEEERKEKAMSNRIGEIVEESYHDAWIEAGRLKHFTVKGSKVE